MRPSRIKTPDSRKDRQETRVCARRDRSCAPGPAPEAQIVCESARKPFVPRRRGQSTDRQRLGSWGARCNYSDRSRSKLTRVVDSPATRQPNNLCAGHERGAASPFRAGRAGRRTRCCDRGPLRIFAWSILPGCGPGPGRRAGSARSAPRSSRSNGRRTSAAVCRARRRRRMSRSTSTPRAISTTPTSTRRALPSTCAAPKGLEIAKRLIAVSDIVIENFSSRVLRNWGLGYDVLREHQARHRLCVDVGLRPYRPAPPLHDVRPGGAGGVGADTPLRTAGQAAGRLGLVVHGRYRRDVRRDVRADRALSSQHDRPGPAHRPVADGVERAAESGRRCSISRSTGAARGGQGFPPGNRAHWPGTPVVNNYRGPTVAPHNAYRTDPGGYNDWCVIVCHSDEEWQRLVEVMGAPSWAVSMRNSPPSPGGCSTRRSSTSGIEAWTMTLGKYEVTERCQAAGVRALAGAERRGPGRA